MTYLAALSRPPNAYGLIHNDLHPWNFLVDNGQITVIDFDVCKMKWFFFKLSVIILICCFAGLVLGFYVGSNVVEGAYNRWETMALPEGLHPTNLVTGDKPIAYLQTKEGELLMHGCASRTYPGTTNWQSTAEIISMTLFLQHNVRCAQEQPYQNWPTISKPRSKVQAQVYCIIIRMLR